MANNNEPFKLRNAVCSTFVTLSIVLGLGTLFSLVFYKPLCESNNRVARQLGEAIRNLFSNVGFYLERECLINSQTPQELGKDKCLAIVSRARNILSKMPANRKIKFTLGVHIPIQTRISNQSQFQIKEWEAIGLVSRYGELIPLTVGDLQEMFEKKPHTLCEDSEAYGLIDLIVYNTQTKESYQVQKTRLNDFFRDALNATLNGELKINQH